MRLLLDTHIVLWWLAASLRLGKPARVLIESHDCAISVATLIESRLLARTGRANIPDVSVIADHLERTGISTIPLTSKHIAESARFENSHPDIYDRLLLGVAIVENRPLLTRDVALLKLAAEARLSLVIEG